MEFLEVLENKRKGKTKEKEGIGGKTKKERLKFGEKMKCKFLVLVVTRSFGVTNPASERHPQQRRKIGGWPTEERNCEKWLVRERKQRKVPRAGEKK